MGDIVVYRRQKMEKLRGGENSETGCFYPRALTGSSARHKRAWFGGGQGS